MHVKLFCCLAAAARIRMMELMRTRDAAYTFALLVNNVSISRLLVKCTEHSL